MLESAQYRVEIGTNVGASRRGVLASACDVADRAQVEQGEGRRTLLFALVIAFPVIMLLQLGERLSQRSLPEQDQTG